MILGIEGGGTKTTWAVLSGRKVAHEGVLGPGNTLLLSNAKLRALFRAIRRQSGGDIEAIGGAFAGCKTEAERTRVCAHLQHVWPEAGRIVVGGDIDSAFAGAHGDGDGIAVIAGTGSNVIGRRGDQTARAGGWGHIFADEGSAYWLARCGLEMTCAAYDRTGRVDDLGRRFLRATGEKTVQELVPRVLTMQGKQELAALAKCVFEAARSGHEGAQRLLKHGASDLADRVGWVARRLKWPRPRVAMIGSLFTHRPEYEKLFRSELKKRCPADVSVSRVPGAVGAAALARPSSHRLPACKDDAEIPPDPNAHPLPATEERNPRSAGLQKKSVQALVDLFIDESHAIDEALRERRREIAKACRLVTDRLKSGGRLFYVGAGTSGRLGVLDASEMPPTFNAPPQQVQAIIAGGTAAILKSVEGAEDDTKAGTHAIRQARVGKRDAVCGIAASGRTPFVLGALREAKTRGAATLFLTCNPRRPPAAGIDAPIDLPTGPELVTGSTRLKAGTATKEVLNMLSTIAMIRLGRVHDNLMIDVQATNEKLRHRAIRLVQTLTGCNEEAARLKLEESRWNVRATVLK